MKNLTEGCTEDSLKEFFEDDDVEVTEVRLPKKRDGLCKGYEIYHISFIKWSSDLIKK